MKDCKDRSYSWARKSRLAGAALCLAGAGMPGLAEAAIVVTDDPALYWSSLVSTTLAGPPVLHSRSMAMAQVAIFEAANLTSGTPYSSYLHLSPQQGDTRTAIAVAARNVLVAVNPARAADYDAALTATLALVADGQAKTDGIAVGNAVAAAMLARRAGDGYNTVVPYSPQPPGTPGAWQPTPPAFAAPIAPQWGDVTPWVVASADQFLAAPPPALDSAAYADAYNEVKDIGAVGSLSRTAEQTAAALFWAGTQGGTTWQNAAIDIAQAKGMSTADAAQMLALMAIGNADTFITVWEGKYLYDFWRPITAIRGGDIDGNASTIADPDWVSRLTNPAYPSHSSGLSGVNGNAAAILSAFFGDTQDYCLNGTAGQRCFTSFSAGAQEGADSRIWGGIHFRFETETSLAQGRAIANFTMAKTLRAVPEPQVWLMLILGFGAVGSAMRQQQRMVRAQAKVNFAM